MKQSRADSIISLVADGIVIIEVIAVFVMIAVARIQIKLEEVTYMICLVFLILIAILSIVDE